MNKKLTLNVDEQLIKFAHDYSKTTQQSISKLFEKYINRLRQEMTHNDVSDEANELYGILDKGEVPDKKDLRKAFYEKSLN
ncbi:DUF6364 family protein [Marispirochaeta aestuarii]|jgi:hypothetical protein|uniref:DUF6364 family protein n=1 Tax=Marispirochaeta aestuarii TaxID=1963862 RepID=UPI002ABE2ED8|nr:DUF6364 family protein [Marispirochaeta aestuarii]